MYYVVIYGLLVESFGRLGIVDGEVAHAGAAEGGEVGAGACGVGEVGDEGADVGAAAAGDLEGRGVVTKGD